MIAAAEKRATPLVDQQSAGRRKKAKKAKKKKDRSKEAKKAKKESKALAEATIEAD
jgi:hypothetical protein